MIDFTIFDPSTGAVLRSGTVGTIDLAQRQAAGPHEAVLIGSRAPGAGYVEGSKVVPAGIPPTVHHVFDGARRAWIDPRGLPELRAAQYPALADFADAFYWLHNGDPSRMAAWLDQCAAVKAQHPKTTDTPAQEQ